MRYKFTEEQIKNAVQQSLSIANVCRVLGIRPCGGNYKTLHHKIKTWNIDTSHFTGQGWNIGLKFNPNPKQPLSEILIENSSYVTGTKLKKRLINEGVKKNICEICNLNSWMGKPLILELNHINGNNLDHRLENLQILCPNCHSQTSTHRGKNKLSALSEKKEVEFRKFREALTDNADGNPEPSPYREGAETRHGTSKS
jgi:hypothetical protein